jgi:hypothetical protein
LGATADDLGFCCGDCFAEVVSYTRYASECYAVIKIHAKRLRHAQGMWLSTNRDHLLASTYAKTAQIGCMHSAKVCLAHFFCFQKVVLPHFCRNAGRA